MSVRFAVDLEAIEEHVARAQGFAALVDETLSRLERVVDGLGLTWTGLAADAHRRAHHEWSAAAGEMASALGAMASAAQRARADYSAAATSNLHLWSPLA